MMYFSFPRALGQIGVVLLLASAVQFQTAPPAQSQSLLAEEAKTRINVAGRQRMLLQRMVKSACFFTMGIERASNREALATARDLFQNSLRALQSGDAALGLGPERNSEIVDRLAGINSAWYAFSNMANLSLSPKGLGLADFQEFDALGLGLLGEMNETVRVIAQTYGNQIEELPLILSITIDIAGRQRMLTQKIAKEFCLIDAGVDVATNLESLKASLQLFNNTLEGLQNGMQGILVAAPNYDIRKKLAEVVALWGPVNGALQVVASGGQITDLERSIVVDNMDTVLNAMNEAVGMYAYVNSVPWSDG